MTSHPLPIPDKKAKFNKTQFLVLAPRLVKLLKPHTKNLAIGFLALIGASSLNLLFPYLIREYLNENIGQVLSENLYNITFILILLFVAQGILFYLRHFYLQIVGLKITADMRENLVKKLLQHEIVFFDKSRLGDLLSRLNSDTEVLQKGLSVNISVALRYFLQVVFGVFLMIYLSPLLTSIIVGIIPILAIFSIGFSKKLKLASAKTQQYLGDAAVSAEEALTAIRVVKLFNSEDLEHQKFSTNNTLAYKNGFNRIQLAAAFSSSMVTVLHCSIAIVFMIGGKFVNDGNMTIGDFTAFIMYCFIVAVSFGFLLNAWAEFVQSLGAADRIYQILDGQIEVNSDQSSNREITGSSIEFKDVSFSYPARPEQVILNKLNFLIPENETTAIVGPSGAGKSTIVSLIPRLYEITAGEILINQTNITAYSLKKLRAAIAFVPQNPQLFSSSLRDNITYGKPDATEADIQKTIKDAALTELVEKLPQGLDTTIGDKGIQLSGGERQRVSIARALLINPKILILDEATSSLDSQNENLIQIALEKARQNRTVVIIAHRLSTVKNADQVLVIKDGEVIQKGSHSELSSKDGLYRNLVEFQLT